MVWSFALHWHMHQKSPQDFLLKMLASHNPELFQSFEKLKNQW